ncbi:MAG: DUF2080 family transposase-associated protein [Candidatus Pacearchaeota archaeon]|nr:DUF2080 family transposase-associated protein [Candidatus Pacearchaeota archaeon]
MIGKAKIVRRASPIGNGAHVFVPKEWAGNEIVLTKKPVKPVNERVLEALGPYLKEIEGVYLFGSYVRGEERENSDIDLFIISDRKINVKENGFSVICINESKFESALKIAPILIYSMLSEAKPIINGRLLERLREKYKPNLRDFRKFLLENEGVGKINEGLIEEDSEYTKNTASVYSLILRLRGMFIIYCLLLNKQYSYKSFKKWIRSNIKGLDFDKLYSVYLDVKVNKERDISLKTNDLIKLLDFLNKETELLKSGKKKQET